MIFCYHHGYVDRLFATRTGAFSAFVASFYDGIIPGYVAIILTPLGMMLASVVELHPVISGTAC